MGFMKWFKGLKKKKVFPAEVTDQNFDELVLRSPIPVIVDVWSESCSWCNKLVPTIVELSTKYDGRVRVLHCNAGTAMKSAGRMGVRGTPTVAFFNNGKMVEKVSGFRPQHYFEEAISVLFPEALEPVDSAE